MKILNLYSGIGGNRKLWRNDHEITAVEYNKEIADIYKDFFPDDNVIIDDAHQYLLDHYSEFDFIWSSPPCPTHSRARYWSSKGDRYKIQYPDMKLYQEIIFLKHFFKGKWVIENVKPYYEPLISHSIELGRHLFWSNFNIKRIDTKDANIHTSKIKDYSKFHGFDLSKFKIKNRKDQILRNCVYPETGLHILNCAIGSYNQNNVYQIGLFSDENFDN